MQSNEAFLSPPHVTWLIQSYIPNVTVGALNLDVTQPVAASRWSC